MGSAAVGSWYFSKSFEKDAGKDIYDDG